MFIDPNSGRRHDYCGRSHAVEHRLILDQRRQEDEEEEAAIQFSMNQSIHPKFDQCSVCCTERSFVFSRWGIGKGGQAGGGGGQARGGGGGEGGGGKNSKGEKEASSECS